MLDDIPELLCKLHTPKSTTSYHFLAESRSEGRNEMHAYKLFPEQIFLLLFHNNWNKIK